MTTSSEPLVVCVHHPAKADFEPLQASLGELGREVDLRCLPYKESVKLRLARRRKPVDAALLETAPTPGASVEAAWREAGVILTMDLPEERLDEMPNLAWVQAYSAGVEQFPVEALAERGIALTNAAGAGAPAIAEFVMGRLIEVFRNLRDIEAMQRAREFHRPGGRTLAGCTLGIVGLGAIGSAVAGLGRAFGMHTIATRRSAKEGEVSQVVDTLRGPAGLEELLAVSDVIVLCAPATPETENLIDAAALARMKPGAVLCNVARGVLVDERALAESLAGGQLAAAILDVTRREPLPADDPLWEAPNLYLSPHSSIPPDAYDQRLLALFADNLGRFTRGEPLVNAIDCAAVARQRR